MPLAMLYASARPGTFLTNTNRLPWTDINTDEYLIAEQRTNLSIVYFPLCFFSLRTVIQNKEKFYGLKTPNKPCSRKLEIG